MSRAWAVAMFVVGICLLGSLVRECIRDFRGTEYKRELIRRQEERRRRKAAWLR